MSDTSRSDLAVEPISDALEGWTLDVVVSGSIGAVESVRFIRALRRLGADVRPWLTSGGSRFVTEVAVAWAAGRPAVTQFSGDASHVATGRACVVAPASANFIGHVAGGLTDSPATALVASYLGCGRPVCMVPNMHSSLGLSPAVETNTAAIERMGVHFLASRDEEGKRKFPDPAWLADEVSHYLRRFALQHSQSSKVAPRVLVTMGTTRGYIDDVRYVSNYSSGALGSLVVEELHRHGVETDVICGPSPIRPRNFWRMTPVETNSDMAQACRDALGNGASGAILAASVLDFAPEHKTSGKIKSADHERLSLSMVRQPKIISDIHPSSGVKVGFKLETGLTEEAAFKLAQSYMTKYSLSLMVINDLRDVDQSRHKAWFFEQRREEPGTVLPMGVVETKLDVARRIARHILSQLSS